MWWFQCKLRMASCTEICLGRMLSSNISDPCLLASTPNEIYKHPSDNPATADQSTIDSEINSLDSGILDEGSGGTGQVYKTIID